MKNVINELCKHWFNGRMNANCEIRRETFLVSRFESNVAKSCCCCFHEVLFCFVYYIVYFV